MMGEETWQKEERRGGQMGDPYTKSHVIPWNGKQNLNEWKAGLFVHY
jgi:hypothetical protein